MGSNPLGFNASPGTVVYIYLSRRKGSCEKAMRPSLQPLPAILQFFLAFLLPSCLAAQQQPPPSAPNPGAVIKTNVNEVLVR